LRAQRGNGDSNNHQRPTPTEPSFGQNCLPPFAGDQPPDKLQSIDPSCALHAFVSDFNIIFSLIYQGQNSPQTLALCLKSALLETLSFFPSICPPSMVLCVENDTIQPATGGHDHATKFFKIARLIWPRHELG